MLNPDQVVVHCPLECLLWIPNKNGLDLSPDLWNHVVTVVVIVVTTRRRWTTLVVPDVFPLASVKQSGFIRENDRPIAGGRAICDGTLGTHRSVHCLLESR